jgi:hypothetical protein
VEPLITSLALAAGPYLAEKAADALLKRFGDYLARNDLSFKEARDELFRGWASELAVASNEVAKEVRRLGEDFERQSEERAENHEAQRVLMNYAEQAYREPIDERRRMLAHAAAGILDVRLTIAQHAKVQRILHELDPDDVLVLWGLSLTCGHVVSGKSADNDGGARYFLWDQSPSRDTLLAAGLVQLPPPGALGPGHLAVTRLSGPILTALRSFLATRKPPFEVPGREEFAWCRPESGAREVLRELPREVFEAARVAAVKQYDAPKRNVNGEQVYDPPVNAMGRLTLVPIPVELGSKLVHAMPREAGKDPDQPGVPASRVRIFASPMTVADGSAAYNVAIEGPHDAMRWLAEDLGALWA